MSAYKVTIGENTSFGVHEGNKIRSDTEEIKFSGSFMLLFTIIKLLPTLRLSRQKTNSFPSRFASILSCSACWGGGGEA